MITFQLVESSSTVVGPSACMVLGTLMTGNDRDETDFRLFIESRTKIHIH